MINIPTNKYIEFTNSGRSLTKEFYCLSLKSKFQVVREMEAEGLIPLDYKLLDKLILAVLQHSPKSSIKDHPVSKERKIRPEAREADKLENVFYTQETIDVLKGLEQPRKRGKAFTSEEEIENHLNECNLRNQATLDEEAAFEKRWMDNFPGPPNVMVEESEITTPFSSDLGRNGAH